MNSRNSYPLNFGQEQSWSAARAAGRSVPNLHVTYEVEGELSLHALFASLHAIVRRHDALRVTVHRPEDGPAQHLDLPAPDDRQLITLEQAQARSVEQFAEYVSARVRQEVATGWSGEEGYPFRFLLLRANANLHVLIATFSHLIFDGRSMTIFTSELISLYNHFRAHGTSADLPAAASFRDAAARERARFGARAENANSAYWRRRLAPVPGLRGLAARQTGDGEALEPAGPISLTGDHLDALREICTRLGCTVFQRLLWAYAGALVDLLDFETLIVFTPHDSREAADRDVLGMFVSSLPLVVDRAPEGGVAIEAVQRELLRGLYRQHVPATVWSSCADELDQSIGLDLRRCPSVTYIEHDFDWRDGEPAEPGTLRRISVLRDVRYRSPMLDMIINSYPDRVTVHLSFNRGMFDHDLAAAVVREVESRIVADSR